MAIPKKISKEQFEILPDFMQADYKVADDGSYVLGEVEGMIDKKTVDEFRNNNRTLQGQIDDLTNQLAVFAEVDVEKFKEMQEQQRLLDEKELIDKGEIDPIVEARMKPIIAKKDEQIAKLQAAVDSQTMTLSQLLIDDKTSELAAEMGVLPGSALGDVKRRAREQFKVKDGAVGAFDSEGNTVYGEDGITPLALDKAWMESVKKDAWFLFNQPKGTDAPGDGGTRRPGQVDTSKMSAAQKISHGLNEDNAA